ncbi:MAG: tetratricopeptide repeat protein, partial [Gammaproteobacteria bacterium]|nr:tetratricopeptide repeat protein [Gammaproteobacteria bacterium]
TFDTVTDAVNCCIKLQDASKEIDDLDLRIGIHQGEILIEENDIIGDDVNIAARIEPFSAPGGIAVSNKVHDAIIRESEFETKYLGKPKLKGVGQKVEVYCITSHDLPETNLSQVSAKLEPEGFQWNVMNSLGIAASVIGLFMLINFMFLRIGYADKDETPSIAILPFENKGAEADEFYAYGISSDLIADVTSAGLIRVAGLKDVEKLDYANMSYDELSNKLYVRYVAQGTLWKMDSVFQLSMEIFDTKLSKVIYTKRWQTNWTDLATIKDDLSDNILETLEIKILQDPEKQIVDSNPKAYAYYLEAKHKYEKRENKDDVEIARGLLNKAIEFDDNLIKAKILLGVTYVSMGEYDMAMDIYTSALKQAELNGDKRVIGSSLNNIGNIYYRKGEYDQALDHHNRSLKISEEVGNKSGIGNSLNNIGIIYGMRGEYDQTLDYFSRFLKISEELGDKDKIGISLNNIGALYMRKGEYDQALDHYNRALKIREEMGHKSRIGKILNNIGAIHVGKGEYDQALEYYSRALKISEELGDKSEIGQSLNNIGASYWRKGEYDQALDYFSRSLEIREELGDKNGIGECINNIGAIHWGKGEYDQALEYYSRALKIMEEMGHKSRIGQSLNTIGVIYVNKGEYDQALNYFSRALKIGEELGDKSEIGRSLNNIGIYYYYKGEYDKAVEYLEKSLHIKQEIGGKGLELFTTIHFYLAKKQLGKDYDEQEIHRLIKEEENIEFENNFRLYELLEDNSFLEAAYNQIQEKADVMDDELKE